MISVFADPPVVSLSLGKNLEANGIKENDDVYFECNITSNPASFKVSWKKDVSCNAPSWMKKLLYRLGTVLCVWKKALAHMIKKIIFFKLATRSHYQIVNGAKIGRNFLPTFLPFQEWRIKIFKGGNIWTFSRVPQCKIEKKVLLFFFFKYSAMAWGQTLTKCATNSLCINFFLQGQELSPAVNSNLIINQNSLVIQNVNRESAGKYVCEATNTAGKGSSDQVQLNIKCETVPSVVPPKVPDFSAKASSLHFSHSRLREPRISGDLCGT